MIERILTTYDTFIQQFPLDWHGPISLILTLAVAGAIWHALRKSGLWLLALIILVPALVPTLRGVGQFLIELLKSLLDRASA